MTQEQKNYGLNELAKELHDFQIEAGFTDSNISQRLMLCVTEISEAFEAFRKDRYTERVEVVESQTNDESFMNHFRDKVKDTLEDELADAIIRLLAFCGENNIDIEKHVMLKRKYNNLRGFKYGGKKF